MNARGGKTGNRIIEHHIEDTYKMNVDEFSWFLATKFINDPHQRKIFLKKGVWLKVKLNYIGALILTQGGKEIFTPKDIRDVIREHILPSLRELSDNQLRKWYAVDTRMFI